MNVAEIVEAQRLFFRSHQTRDLSFRVAQLKKLRVRLKLLEAEFYKAIYTDFKKSEFDTYADELGFVYAEIDEAIRKLPKWARHQRVKTNLANLPGRSFVVPEPLGVTLVIGAWNYPYRLSLIPMVSAIAAGNTVVVKPSELPVSTSAVMARLINDEFPVEYLHVVEGGVPETRELLQQKWDKIFFTGSTNVGKIVYEAAAKNLTPVTLELGGKNPAIVTRDTNLKDAAKRIIWSKFLNAGQTCITPDYILIDRSVEAEFLDHAKAYIHKFDYSFEHGNYVQIINDRNFQRLLKLLDRNKIFVGGEVQPETRYISPTILTKVTFEDPIMQEEIFGPLLPVISFADLDDAFNLVVPRPKPLACYIFTHDARIKAKFLNELSFGGGAINDTVMHISNPHLPYGGVGESGTGSYQFQSGFATFSHYKAVLSKPFWFEPDFKYPPYTKRKLSLVKWLLAH